VHSVPVEILVDEGAPNCIGKLWLSCGFDANGLMKCGALYKASFCVITLPFFSMLVLQVVREEQAKKKCK